MEGEANYRAGRQSAQLVCYCAYRQSFTGETEINVEINKGKSGRTRLFGLDAARGRTLLKV